MPKPILYMSKNCYLFSIDNPHLYFFNNMFMVEREKFKTTKDKNKFIKLLFCSYNITKFLTVCLNSIFYSHVSRRIPLEHFLDKNEHYLKIIESVYKSFNQLSMHNKLFIYNQSFKALLEFPYYPKDNLYVIFKYMVEDAGLRNKIVKKNINHYIMQNDLNTVKSIIHSFPEFNYLLMLL